MIFLLDVNALIALGYKQHAFHRRVCDWAVQKSLLTCSITELGFIRVLTQLPEANVTIALCRNLLSTMKEERKMVQIPDSRSAVNLPEWVVKPSQCTDGHLKELAKVNDAVLATLDEGIPDVLLIPK